MSFFKRAMLAITRNFRKTLILGLLLTLLGTLLSGALSVNRGIGVTQMRLVSQMPAVATLVFDGAAATERDGIPRTYANWEQLSPKEVNQIGRLPYVQSYDLTIMETLLSHELEWARIPVLPELLEAGTIDIGLEGMRAVGLPHELFPVKGVQNPAISHIEGGLLTLYEGRVFTDHEIKEMKPVTLVSRTFASANQLTVGSLLTFEQIINNPFNVGEILAERSLELEVIGIFDVAQEFYLPWNRELTAVVQETALHNTLYVPSLLAEAIFRFSVASLVENNISLEVLGLRPDVSHQNFFLLNSPLELADFRASALELLSEFWEVEDLSLTWGHLTTAMSNLEWLSNLILWGTIGAILLITSLLLNLFLRDRKAEIGLYLALGERKTKIVAQLLTETFTIMLVSLGISLFMGNFLSRSLSTHLLAQHITAYQDENTIFNQDWHLDWNLLAFRVPTLTTEEITNAYDTSLGGTTVFLFLGASILAVLLSTLLPIFTALKQKPNLHGE